MRSALVSLALLAACSDGVPPARPADVILITIDTLRADHLGLYGYARDTTPNIDRWFGDGAIFERAYAAEASTSPSVATILSGRYPQEHRVRLFYQLLSPDVPLIPDLLPEQYQSAAFVSNMVLTDEALGIAARFDHYDDYVSERESRREVYERNAGHTTDAAIAWLEAARDPRRPLFLWVHYIDPHGPYRPPETWAIPFEPGEARPIPIERVPRHIREPGLEDGHEYVRRYDGEIAYTDREIGRLLEAYARENPIDEALLILTADHGESMMDHERWFTHGYHVYEEIVRVPLLVRGPGVEAGRVRLPVSSIDLLPTVLRHAGLEPPDFLEGSDLRNGSRLDPGRVVYSEASDRDRQWRAAVRGDDKWVVAVQGPARTLLEQRLYDVRADPLEQSPGPPAAAAAPLERLLELIRRDPDPAGIPSEFRQGIKLGSPKVAPGVPAQQLERLRELGYAE